MVTLPAALGHKLAQQVVVVSDGVIRCIATDPDDSALISMQAPVVVAAEDTKPAVTTVRQGRDHSQIESVIIDALCQTLKLQNVDVDRHLPFSDYGIDSILGIRFVKDVSKALGVTLNTAVIFDYTSVARLATHLNETYAETLASAIPPRLTATQSTLSAQREGAQKQYRSNGWQIPVGSSPPWQSQLPTQSDSPFQNARGEDIAVIGMSGQFPGAKDVASFWDLLRNGRDGVTDFTDGDLVAKAGVLADRDCFDPLFFNLSPREANSMNPHQRLILQEGWKSLEDAGYNPRTLDGQRVALYIGAEPTGYQRESFTGASDAIIASRLSYYLNLKGPAMVVNTGCSSSGVALHLACESLRRGEATMALAGGVYAAINGEVLAMLTKIGMLSQSGRCATFDASADGTVFSEGVGVVVLKRLADAERDGDPIYGVIEGTGINQDGASNGITAPNGTAQESLMLEVYKRFEIAPESISYVEAHGTGTSLGDPVEANALVRAFKKFTDRRLFCALGSAKAHVGHTSASAAVIGLIKVLLSMKHKTLPGLLHFKTLNPVIQLEDSAFFIPTEIMPWHPAGGTIRRAAISSFGHSGTNAHVVVREYVSVTGASQATEAESVGPYLVPLSAKGEVQLRASAERLLQALEGEPEWNLRQIAYTLQVGREEMNERVAFLARDTEELKDLLRTFVAGLARKGMMWRGDSVSRPSQDLILGDDDLMLLVEQWLRNGQLDRLAQAWCRGLAVDWRVLYGEDRPSRVHLPTYPFLEDQYGLTGPPRGERSRGDRSGSILSESSLKEPLASSRVPCRTSVSPSAAPSRDRSLSRVDAWHNPDLLYFEEQWTACSPPVPTDGPQGVVVCWAAEQATRQSLEKCAGAAKLVFVGDEMQLEANTLLTIEREYGTIDGVVYARTLEDELRCRDLASLAGLVQTLAALETTPRRLLLVGASRDPLTQCYAESWIGFERSLSRVLPSLAVGVVVGTPSVEQVWAEYVALRTSVSIGYQLGERQRLQVVEVEPAQRQEAFHVPETILITGGGGGLGSLFADYFARQRARLGLVLVGRSPLTAEQQQEIARLEADGHRVVYLQADVTDAEAMREGIARAKAVVGPIRAVVHAAGIGDARSVLEKDRIHFEQVLAPKVQGTLVLDEVLRDEPLAWICYFSSASAVLGDFGNCNYAVANRFLMAYAQYRAERRLPGKTLSIQWPLWDAGGMGFANAADRARYLAVTGQRAMDPATGFVAFEEAWSVPGRTQAMCLIGEREALLRLAIRTHDSRMEVVQQGQQGGTGQEEIEDALAWTLMEQVSRVLGMAPSELHADANLVDVGFDSIGLIELASTLSGHFGWAIKPTIFFGSSTLSALQTCLLQQFGENLAAFYRKPNGTGEGDTRHQDGEPDKPIEQVVERPQRQKIFPITEIGSTDSLLEPIAIIGMSGRFPQARDIDALWQILAEGRDVVEPVPLNRVQNGPTRQSGIAPDLWSGLVPGVAEFDPLFFELSPAEAETMDPRQRLLLQEAWRALENAGIGPKVLRESRVGMFVGVEEGDYVRFEAGGSITANHSGVLAARLAYFLDLRGPALAINTACSSGLVALHQAAQSIRMGECDIAIVAGVNLILHHESFVGLRNAGMLSTVGRLRAFDQDADGMVPGEAVAVVVLKRQSTALADGDPIQALLRASGVNYDGKTNGITAPSGVAQASLIADTYRRFGISADDIEHVVTHGTGTRLGDPVEAQALQDAFRQFTDRRAFCALTSTKSNLGHTFAPSGLVSVIALVEGMKHGVIPASLHCEQENPFMAWNESSFYVNKERRAWPASIGRNRLGAVSAFGMSGTNAHVVIEEAGTVPTSDPSLPVYVLPLSAKTPEALREMAANLAQMLEDRGGAAGQLAGLACTLQDGRHAFTHRLAIVVRDAAHAAELLRGFVSSQRTPGSKRAELATGVVARDFIEQKGLRRILDALTTEDASNQGQYAENMAALAALFCQGYTVPWANLYRGQIPRRVVAPGYPFAREIYWPAIGGAGVADSVEVPEVMAEFTLCRAVSQVRRDGSLDKRAVDFLPIRYGDAGIEPWKQQGRYLVCGPHNEMVVAWEQWIVARVGAEVIWLDADLPPGDLQGAVAAVQMAKGPLHGLVYTGSDQEWAKVIQEVAERFCGSATILLAHQFALSSLDLRGSYFLTAASGKVTAWTTVLPDRGFHPVVGEVTLLDGRCEELKQHDLVQAREIERVLADLVWATLLEMGVFRQRQVVQAYALLDPLYHRWLDDLVLTFVKQERLAQAGGHLTILHEGAPLADLWKEWEQAKLRWEQNAAVTLVEACLRALPQILAGQLPPEEVLFPRSSVELVEDAHKESPVASFYNELLAESLLANLAQRLKIDPAARICILEIGAGTGATTAVLLRKLAPYAANIEEYAYTDLSKAFLFHAEKHYQPANPYLRTAIFDVEQPLAGQEIGLGRYDYVVATNVLHATRQIRRTLRNVKAAMARGGLLFLNELSGKFLMSHVTFGLLKGWWLHEDTALRIPGSPGMFPQAWCEVLTEEGFSTIAFPAATSHVLGQQVIIAQSDGVIRQEEPVAKPSQPVTKQPKPEVQTEIKATASPLPLRSLAVVYFQRLFSEVLRMDAEKIDPQESLGSYGLDSILITGVNQRLREAFGDVGSALLFKFQTLEALVDYFLESYAETLTQVVGGARQESALLVPVTEVEPRPVQPSTKPTIGDIAIIGMHGRYPKANDLATYWNLLREAVDCVEEMPTGRWPLAGFFEPDKVKAVAEGKSYTTLGGWLDGIDEFDPLFFNISPQEARFMDPQERLFLQVVWSCLEEAGYIRPNWQKDPRDIGVFVGVSYNNYQLFLAEAQKKGVHYAVGSQTYSIANRVSYFFNLTGPSATVDTACSSSLFAIHQACEAIYNGTTKMALAGGVNLSLHPSKYVTLCASGFASTKGHCHAFAADGDGLVPSEAVGVVLLKPLADAQADGDRILAVIKGTGVSQDGRTQGYTVPNPVAQTRAIRMALDRAGVHPETISYVEAHGTGTALGDPIEVQGLVDAFEAYTGKKQFCAIGSVKANIGHGEAAAGIGQLTKVVLQLRHQTLAPSLLHGPINPNLDLKRTPFVLQKELAPWVAEHPRRAGISSFGAGGVNVHVIVEEAPPEPPAQAAPESDSYIVPLSAHVASQLPLMAKNLADFLAENETVPLVDVAYTLQMRRATLRHRLAVVGHNTAEVQEKLRAYLAGDHRQVLLGDAKGDRTSSRTTDAKDGLVGEAERWVRGEEVAWERAWQGQVRQPLSLPSYPFLKQRFWITELIPANKREEPAVQGQAPAVTPVPTSISMPISLNGATPAKRSGLVAALVDLSVLERQEVMETWIAEQVATSLGFDRAEEVDVATGFFELGMESLQAQKMAQACRAETGLELPDTLLFEYPTTRTLAEHLLSGIPWDDLAARSHEQLVPEESLADGEGAPVTSPAPMTLADEALAVVGMACRFPGGAATPEAFWDLLARGGEGLRDVPSDRWNHDALYDPAGGPGKSYVKQCNFLAEDVSLFDPALFNISPREAEEMDPQQRLLLELTWEGLERAGIAASSLRGTAVGVFMGIIGSDYAMLPRDPEAISPYTMTGITSHMASGRISHVFGFHGPALSFDTACSSSLVALHQACESVRSGESEVAIAGGVGLMLTPESFIGLCKMKALSPDGRCKPFAAGGDGYGRGEGGGLVVIKRLRDAQRDGDPVLAIIEGSAMNHDGASSGLTVPNAHAQQALLEQALQRAKLSPDDIGYLETHGTGTSLGDPIEFGALRKVFGPTRSADRPLILGTCKANIGHLEAAAGIAGVIKTVLCLQHRQIPPHINCPEINPRVTLTSLPARLASSCEPWTVPAGQRRFAGVSSFGFSGTNAHVILGEAPARQPSLAKVTERSLQVLTLSAQRPETVCRKAADLADLLAEGNGVDLASLAHSANVGRVHFEYRVALEVTKVEDLRSQLAALTEQDVVRAPKPAKVMIVFAADPVPALTGVESMLQAVPVFRSDWKACEAAFESFVEGSLTNALSAAKRAPAMDAAISFALRYATYRLLQHVGVQVHSVYGEGEGLFALAAAVGMMPVAVAAQRLIQRYHKGPSVVREGDSVELTMPEVRVLWPGRSKPLTRPDLRDPRLFDAVAAEPISGDLIRGLLPQDQALICELHSHLVTGKRWNLETTVCRPVFDKVSFEDGYLRLLAQCYRLGHSVDWQAVDAGRSRQRLLLPTYPFRQRRYWIPVLEKNPVALSVSRSQKPFVGQLQSSPSTEKRFDFALHVAAAPELRDTHGVVHVGYILEMLRGAIAHLGQTLCQVTRMRFDVALIVPEEDGVDVQLILQEQEQGFDFAFYGRPRNASEWTRHIKGHLDVISANTRLTDSNRSPEKIQQHLSGPLPGALFYQGLEGRGVHLGPSVQWVEEVWQDQGEALARFRLPVEKEQVADGLGLHAGIWDACAQLFHATLGQDVAKDSVFMLTDLGEASFDTPARVWPLWCHAWSNGHATDEGFLEGGFALFTDAGDLLAVSGQVRMKEITAAHREALSRVTQVKPTNSAGRNEAVLLDWAATGNPDERRRQVGIFLQEKLSALLRMPLEELDITESTLAMGMDSLVGLEFQQLIRDELEVELPLSLLLEGPSVEALATEVLKRLVLDKSRGENVVAQNGHRHSLSTPNLNADAWLMGTRKPNAAIRLFCFPYGNQSGAMYRNWVKAFPEAIEVRPIELPGRGGRLKERPFESVQALVETLTKVLDKDLDRPFAIFGHSVGALLGYAWCLQLAKSGHTLPRHLFVSAYTCPTLKNSILMEMKRAYRESAGLQTLPSVDDVLEPANEILVNRLVNVAQAGLADMRLGDRFAAAPQELIRAQLANGVAALQLVDGFNPASIVPLTVPITALHGDRDEQVSLDEMKAWESLTTSAFTCKSFPGNHVFVDADQCEAQVIQEIIRLLLPDQGNLKIQSS